VSLTLSSAAKARVRLVVVVIALLPVALLARACSSGRLAAFVQRGWATAWKHYDATTDAGSD
jgi:hypothetical protein